MPLAPNLSLMRPSCGTRRSAMFSCAMILMRDVRAARILIGGFITSCSALSTRYRTRISCSNGSMWMSDAPRFTASVSSPLISFTTGASSARSCALAGQHLGDFGLLDEAQLHQGVAEAHPRVLLLEERLFELVLGDKPLPQEDLTQLVGGGCCGRRTQLVENEQHNIVGGEGKSTPNGRLWRLWRLGEVGEG